MIRSEELCSDSSENWDKRAEAFTLNTRKILLSIIRERIEIPRMFAVRDIANCMKVMRHLSLSLSPPPPLPPSLSQSRIEELAKNLDTAPTQAPMLQYLQTEDDSAMKKSNTEAAGNKGSQEEDEQLPSLLSQQQQAGALEIVGKEDNGAMGQDHHDLPVTDSDHAVPSSLSGVVDRSIK